MHRSLFRSVSALAFAVLALPALAQPTAATVDPYGYGNVPLPPPLPSYQAQQSVGVAYTPLAQYAPQYAAASPQYGVVPNYLPASTSYGASPFQASNVGYVVAGQLPNVGAQVPAYTPSQDVAIATQQYAPQQYVTQQVASAAPQYQTQQYATQASVAAAPTYDTSVQQQTYQQLPQPQGQYQQPQVQTYAYAPQGVQQQPVQQQYTTQQYTQQAYAQPQYAPQTYTTNEPLTVTAETPSPSRDVSLATDPSVGPWYFALRTGITIPQDTEFTFAGTNVGSEYQTGWQLGTAVGYEFQGFNRWLAPRAELELVYDQQSVDAHNVGAVNVADPLAYGHVRSLDLLANGYLDFRLSRWVSPYIGGGVGVGYSDFDRLGTSAGGVALDDNDVGFIWQAMGGLGINVSSAATVDVGYRYLQNTGVTLTARDGTKSTTDVGKHVFMIGFRNNF